MAHENHICGEVEYHKDTGGFAHSDICFDPATLDKDGRKYLHDVLDEWLDKGAGTGYFALGLEEVLDAYKDSD